MAMEVGRTVIGGRHWSERPLSRDGGQKDRSLAMEVGRTVVDGGQKDRSLAMEFGRTIFDGRHWSERSLSDDRDVQSFGIQNVRPAGYDRQRCYKMSSGDNRQKGLIKNIFGIHKKVIVGSSSRPVCTESTSSSQLATQSQPSPPLPTPVASSPHTFYSPDPRLPLPYVTQSTPFYPYYPPPPPHSGPLPYPYPYPYALYIPPPHQPATAPPQPTTGGPSTPAAAEQVTKGCMLIEPDDDTYKAVLGRESTPVELHIHTHKRQEEQQWVDERTRKAFEEYTRIRESQAAVGEGSSGGSTEYSDYRTWLQAEEGMQHDRVYGLGSQAHVYEG
ncbi:hypothetical protein IEQ34_006375 [Dendrobium chrysotoxum]|uniref:Uncharacterized protein n=1 Tax=Dendrobium chrysotoxum TaxID=161865 RepID=A0AAV7HBL9_DENCH|nr:hypothetical protein IEQ34_006375 [Dendrobium chrysotoxum]